MQAQEESTRFKILRKVHFTLQIQGISLDLITYNFCIDFEVFLNKKATGKVSLLHTIHCIEPLIMKNKTQKTEGLPKMPCSCANTNHK